MLEAEERMEAQQGSSSFSSLVGATTFYEVTIASMDQPKLLSRLSECLVRAGCWVARGWRRTCDGAGGVHDWWPAAEVGASRGVSPASGLGGVWGVDAGEALRVEK